MAQTTRKMLRPHLYQTLKRHPGEIMSVSEIIDRTDGLEEKDLSKISTSLGRIVEDKPEWGVRRAGRGMYVYNPIEAKREQEEKRIASEDIARFIKKYEDGRAILEGTDGEVYIAQRVESLWK